MAVLLLLRDQRRLRLLKGSIRRCPCCFYRQLSVCHYNDNRRDDRGQDVGYRHGVQDSVKAEEYREQQCEADTEYDLTHHGEHSGGRCFSHCLQENEGCFVDAGKDDHAQIDPEGFYCKVGIVGAFICGSKDADKL